MQPEANPVRKEGMWKWSLKVSISPYPAWLFCVILFIIITVLVGIIIPIFCWMLDNIVCLFYHQKVISHTYYLQLLPKKLPMFMQAPSTYIYLLRYSFIQHTFMFNICTKYTVLAQRKHSFLSKTKCLPLENLIAPKKEMKQKLAYIFISFSLGTESLSSHSPWDNQLAHGIERWREITT